MRVFMQFFAQKGVYVKSILQEELKMPKRRCFEIDIIESFNFRRLSKDAKILYFLLISHADDEGVVTNPDIALIISDTDENVINELIHTEFLLKVEDMLVIKHWHRHNKIQPSKVVPSVYKNELSHLHLNSRKEYEFL